jgi:serine/threonine-protein phosphatase 5
MQNKIEVAVGQHNDLQDREIAMLDKEGLVMGDQGDLHDRQSLLVDIEGVVIGEHSDLLNRQIVMGDKDGLAVGEHNDLQDRLISMGDEEGMGVRNLQDIEIIMEDKEGLVVGEHSDMQDKHVDMELGEPTREPISWPLNGEITLDWILNLMETFKWASWNKSLSEFASIMPLFVVEELITKASYILCQEPNCVKIQCDNNTEVVVVGDLRGQYLDLLNIWESVGLPSDKQLFVFNGNYIDRGKSSLELFLVLLAWKVISDHCIFLVLIVLNLFKIYLTEMV